MHGEWEKSQARTWPLQPERRAKSAVSGPTMAWCGTRLLATFSEMELFLDEVNRHDRLTSWNVNALQHPIGKRSYTEISSKPENQADDSEIQSDADKEGR